MSRNIIILGLVLAALVVGVAMLQQRFHSKDTVAASAPVPSVPSLRGKPEPNFALPNLDGATVHSADFKNKVVLVNFWATWCAPCIVEIPWFIEFQKKYGPQGLEIVGISMDDSGIKDVAPFVKKHSMSYTILLGNEDVATQFGGIVGLPTTFLVDRNGNYYAMHRGLVNHDQLEGELENLLGGSNGASAAPASPHAQANKAERRNGSATTPSLAAASAAHSQKG